MILFPFLLATVILCKQQAGAGVRRGTCLASTKPWILPLATAFANHSDTYNPSARDVEAGRTQGQDCAWLNKEFERL